MSLMLYWNKEEQWRITLKHSTRYFMTYCYESSIKDKDEIKRRKQLKMARYTFLRHTNFHLAQEIALRMH